MFQAIVSFLLVIILLLLTVVMAAFVVFAIKTFIFDDWWR